MTILYLVLPLALAFAGAAVAAFVWTVRSGQLDDIETPPRRILFEDEPASHHSQFSARRASVSRARRKEFAKPHREDAGLPARHLREWNDMNAPEARNRLLAQHERLRAQLRMCTDLARLLRSGEQVEFELDLALDQLRAEFAEHNENETAIIRQLLHRPAPWSALLIDRMLEEHVGEHAAFWNLLSGTRGEVVQRIDDLADELDAHMAAEERTFLSPVTLRDDVIAERTGGN
jgi:cbb3-type cytochrome oxidase maturation protein